VNTATVLINKFIFTDRYFTEKMLSKAIEGKPGSSPLTLSLISNSKLSNGDIECMLLEFLFGGVDTVCMTFSWQNL